MSEPSKFEKDIEEVLRGFGEELPKQPSWMQRFQNQWQRWQTVWRQQLLSIPRLRPQTLLLFSIMSIVVAYFFRFPFPLAARYLGLLGIILFFVAFFMSLSGGWAAHSGEIRWRGQVINPTKRGLLDWLRRWFGSSSGGR